MELEQAPNSFHEQPNNLPYNQNNQNNHYGGHHGQHRQRHPHQRTDDGYATSYYNHHQQRYQNQGSHYGQGQHRYPYNNQQHGGAPYQHMGGSGYHGYNNMNADPYANNNHNNHQNNSGMYPQQPLYQPPFEQQGYDQQQHYAQEPSQQQWSFVEGAPEFIPERHGAEGCRQAPAAIVGGLEPAMNTGEVAAMLPEEAGAQQMAERTEARHENQKKVPEAEA